MKRPGGTMSLALLVVGILSLILFFLPGWTVSEVPEEGATETWIGVGLWFSPWWEYFMTRQSDGSFRFHSGIRLLSWSWLLLAAAVVSFNVRHRLQDSAKRDRMPEANETS